MKQRSLAASRHFASAFLFTCLFFVAPRLFAVVYTADAFNGNWSDPTTWLPVGVPGVGDKAIISYREVILDGSFTVGELVISGGTLRGSGTLTVNSGTVPSVFSSGSLGGSVILDIGEENAGFDWTGGNIVSTATLRVPALGLLRLPTSTGDRVMLDNSRLLIQLDAAVEWTENDLEITDNSQIDCSGTLSMSGFSNLYSTDFTGGIGLLIRSGGTLAGVGDASQIDAPVKNFDGTIRLISGSITLLDSLHNSGDIDFDNSSSQLILDGDATRVCTTGTQILGNGEILQLSGTTHFLDDVVFEADFLLAGGAIDGSGLVEFEQSFAWTAGTIDVNMEVQDGGTAAFFGPGAKNFTDKDFAFNGETIWNQCDFSIKTGGTISNGGTWFAIPFVGMAIECSRNGAGAEPAFNNIGTFVISSTSVLLTGEVANRNPTLVKFTNVQFNNTGLIEGGGCVNFSPDLNVSTGIIGPANYDFNLLISPINELIYLGDLNPTGNLNLQIISDAGPGIGHDVLTVTGNMTFSGTLTVTLSGGPAPDFHELVRCDGGPNCRTGSFSGVNLPAGYFFFYTDTSVVVMSNLLPLELSRFEGKPLETGNRLDWQTESENHSDRFEIERSDDRASWLKIGEMPAAGLSAGPIRYFFEDKMPVRAAWYRLRMVDEDGSFDYSPIVFLERNDFADGTFSISPNPVSGDGFFLKTPESAIGQPVELRLIDSTGRLVFEKNLKEAEAAPFIFMEKTLAAGSYFLEVISEKGGQRLPVIFR